MQPDAKQPPSAPSAPPEAQPSDEPSYGYLERGSSGSTADFAVEDRPDLSERSPDTPYARPLDSPPTGQPRDELAAKKDEVDHREAKLDESIEESFPASDPPSFQPKRV